MKEIAGKRVRLVYGFVLGAFTVAVGALFLWQMLTIYFTGVSSGSSSGIYSREIVGKAFSVIAVPFFLWIAMIFVGFILWEIFPCPPEKRRRMPEDYELYRLKKKMPASVSVRLQDRYREVRKEEKLLAAVKITAAALCLAAAIYAVCYLADPSNFFGGDKLRATEAVVNLAVNLLPFAFAALVLLSGVTCYERYSAKKRLPHVKAMVADAAKRGAQEERIDRKTCPVRPVLDRWAAVRKSRYYLIGVRVALACLAVSLIIAGVCNGNMNAILTKAINICLECIGIG